MENVENFGECEVKKKQNKLCYVFIENYIDIIVFLLLQEIIDNA